jgi:4-coumarate--CoA ligase
VPQNLTTWQWLFNSKHSPLTRFRSHEIKSFTNAQTKENLSYHDIKNNATYLSTALVKNYGFQEGEIVSLFSPNNVWYPVAMHGAARVGGIVSGASPAYNVEEMTYALKTASAKFLMTVPGSMAIAAVAAEAAGIPRSNVILLEGTMEGFTTLQELIEAGKSYGDNEQTEEFRIPEGKTNADICGFLSFSSGTTGLPKAVRISRSDPRSHLEEKRGLY